MLFYNSEKFEFVQVVCYEYSVEDPEKKEFEGLNKKAMDQHTNFYDAFCGLQDEVFYKL